VLAYSGRNECGFTVYSSPETPNNRFERSRGRVFGKPKEGVDVWDKVPSFDAGEAPRRSTSSLGDEVMAHNYTTQVASDVHRDGVGVELLSETGEVVAEVFRSDRDHMVLVSTFSFDVPLRALEQLLARAKDRLNPFEDGASLDEAQVGPPHRLRVVPPDG
jgi:hypothetical protein